MRMTLIALLALLCLAAACLAQQMACGDLVQGVKAERPSYGLGECILFEYTIQNNTNQTVTYTFPSSKQYDIWVTRGGDEELYRMSKGKAYLTMMTSMTLGPGDRKSFSTVWNQKDTSGKQCGPGSYTVCAQLTPSGNRPAQTIGHVRIGVRGAAQIPVKISEAIANYDGLVGRRVQISATYKGFSPTGDGNTKGGPPVSRSDWAICDPTGCMYVVGSIALDPTKDSGKNVTVVGKLEKTPNGQIYMVLETATIDNRGGTACPT